MKTPKERTLLFEQISRYLVVMGRWQLVQGGHGEGAAGTGWSWGGGSWYRVSMERGITMQYGAELSACG